MKQACRACKAVIIVVCEPENPGHAPSWTNHAVCHVCRGHPCCTNHCTEQALSKGRTPSNFGLPHTFREGAELAVVVDLGDPEGVGVWIRAKVSSRGVELPMHVISCTRV